MCIRDSPQVPHDTIKDFNLVPSAHRRTLERFYTESDAIWITAWNMRLWWTFAKGRVSAINKGGEDELKKRRTVGWRCQSLKGEYLLLHQIGGCITKTLRTQNAISAIKRDEYRGNPLRYLRYTILGEEDKSLRGGGERVAATLLARLNPGQMEKFTDLLFERNGWTRVSALGKSMPDVDLVLEKNEGKAKKTAYVQVKAEADQSKFNKFREAAKFFPEGKGKSKCEFHFVYHTGAINSDEDKIHLWNRESLIKFVLDGKNKDIYKQLKDAVG
ncbi:MAG: restriction endonuclease, partial [Alphaproteobacteria bacterium]|nr:restriction endonuclease [Alphaproteobacteria bacterium]